RPVFDEDVPALDVTEITHSLAEGLNVSGLGAPQVAYSSDLPRLLRLGGKRRSQRPSQRGPQGAAAIPQPAPPIRINSLAAAHRNRERERRALAHLTLDPDPSVMELYELPRQGQPESRALDLLGGHPHLLELLEDRFLVLGRDTHTGVADGYLNGAIQGFRQDLNAPAFRCELDGIREQVEQDLADLALIGLDPPESLVDAPLQLNAPTPGPLADQHQGIVNGGGEVEVRHLQIHPPCLDLRQVEDVVDKG